MSIEVHVRVRPGVASPVWSSAETVLYSTANSNTRYVYNKVHPSNSSNLTIFQGIEAIVHAAFDGKNVTVMAYGQTGSGKTHSMIGTEQDQGIIPRTAKLLLELASTHPGTTVQAYYTEIYNEGVKDLLEPQRGELALHEAPDGGVLFEKRTVALETFDDFLRLQRAAERNRKYGVTNLNDHSSRSHIILTFEIHRAHRSQRSVINLVDLAGSESAARANTEGVTLREGGFINRSLLTLGNVVDAIVEKRPYVPYRDAKLTRILRNCLGGSGITFILCCVNPSRESYEQTITALRFTQRAMKIKNDPVVVLSIPPLFVHQYAAGAAQLTCGLRESADAEYQKGIRDAYMYCNNTAGSVVTNFQSQVADSMHALANAQRLLVAHDHAMGMARVGRLYNQMNELARQRGRNQDIVDGEQKRQREIDEEIDHRRQRLSRLEAELAEKESAADTDLAGWEYQLHEARQKQVRELDLLLRTEETRRARIRYEWAVCVERITTRYAPALMNTLATACTTHAADGEADTGGGGGGNKAAGAAGTVPTDAAGGALSAGRGTNKAIVAAELRDELNRARAELADLELAHEMVRDDVEQARRAEQGAHSTSQAPLPPLSSSSCRDASTKELGERIAMLEQEERQLRAQAKREIRRESLRQVRESLRRPSRSPQTGNMNSRSVTPQPNKTGGQKQQYTHPGNRDALAHGDTDNSTFLEEEGEEDVYIDDRNDNDNGSHHRYLQHTSSSASRRTAAGVGGGGGLGRGQQVSRGRGRSRSSSSVAVRGGADTNARDSYADGVRNALSVIDSLRSRLKLQQQQQQQQQGASNRTERSSSAQKLASNSGNGRGGRHADPSTTPVAGAHEPTLLEIYGGGGGGQTASDRRYRGGDDNDEEEKENYFGYDSRPGQSRQIAAGGAAGGKQTGAKLRGYGYAPSLHASRAGKGHRNQLEVIEEDDEAFASCSPDHPAPHMHPRPQHHHHHNSSTSPGDLTPPIVGIAARRKWDRQTSNSNPPSIYGGGGGAGMSQERQEVERALYPLHANSHSAERRSHSRRGGY